MIKLKQIIPLYIKSPISTFLQEFNKIPLKLVFYHSYLSFMISLNISENQRVKLIETKNRITYTYIKKKFSKELIYNNNQISSGEKSENIIWIFWWQGVNSAPTIVKRCISSIKENFKLGSVIVIDQNNYKSFVYIDHNILNKFLSGKITITHFSDYYRMALLYEHGGLWIDGSIFVNSELKSDLFEKCIYTIRNPGMDISNISNWNWTVGLIGGWRHNSFFMICRDLIISYWREFDYPIDYFFLDHFVKLIYDKYPKIMQWFENIEDNNSNFYWLQKNANKDYNSIDKEELSSTIFYKISWKGNYKLETEEGTKTLFYEWFNNNSINC